VVSFIVPFWLELGSDQSWELNRDWLVYDCVTNRLYPFVLTGQKIEPDKILPTLMGLGQCAFIEYKRRGSAGLRIVSTPKNKGNGQYGPNSSVPSCRRPPDQSAPNQTSSLRQISEHGDAVERHAGGL